MNQALASAIEKIEAYVEQTTGRRPEPEELAQALTRYFVLKEIGDFIAMSRQQ